MKSILFISLLFYSHHDPENKWHKNPTQKPSFKKKRRKIPIKLAQKPTIATKKWKKIFLYLDLGEMKEALSSSSSLSGTFSSSVDCCWLSISLSLRVFLLLYSSHTKTTCTRHCNAYPQIHILIGVFGLSFTVTRSIVTDTTTNAAFHIMSNDTTGFEYPQSARLSSSSRAAVSLTSMEGPRRPVARPRRADRVVWRDVGEVGGSWRGRSSGAWGSFSVDIFGWSSVDESSVVLVS